MRKSLKIAQLVWPENSIPPVKYGSIQSMVAELTNALVDRGHDLTVFGPKNSKVNARIIAVSEVGTREDKTLVDRSLYRYITLTEFIKRKDEFDLVHSHISYGIFPLLEIINIPVVVTLHGIYKNIHLREAFAKYGKKANFVAISEKQKNILSNLVYSGVVHHGINVEKYDFSNIGGKDMFFTGRLSPAKGLEDAIKISKFLNIPLKIAGKVDDTKIDHDYFEKIIEPELKNQKINYLQELSHEKLNVVFANSKLLICPFKWEEAFGLVMIESMACGTPVVAYNRGAVSEIIKDGETGFIVEPGNLKAMAEAVKKIYAMSSDEYTKMRKACRKHVEENFTAQKMAQGYEKIYQKVMEDWRKK